MVFEGFAEKRRYEQVWSDPERTILTLESFSHTENDGAVDIARAAERTSDPWLKEHLLRHAEDERRHGELFTGLGRSLRERHPEVPAVDESTPFDLASGKPGDEVNAHGFLSGGRYEEFGDVEFVAMLHVAEKRAASLFQTQHDLTPHLPEVREVFASILKDEQYHVSYTKTALARWRDQGRGREVSRALKAAEEARLLGAWKRLGVRAAGNFGRLVLRICYFTLCIPFALTMRGRAAPGTMHTPRDGESGDVQLTSQYL